MAKNKIQDLRDHLFETIELLKDSETNHMTVEKAKAIAAQEPLVHPIWRKFEQRGNHFVARTNDLRDIEEVADWAESWLIEPEEKISRKMRA